MAYTEEQKAYHRFWYHSRTDENKNRILNVKYARLKRIVDSYQEYKNTLKCSKCLENHPACLEFHHINDDKIIDVSLAANRGWSIKRLAEEIAKCVVLCSNCHKKLHYDEKQNAV